MNWSCYGMNVPTVTRHTNGCEELLQLRQKRIPVESWHSMIRADDFAWLTVATVRDEG